MSQAQGEEKETPVPLRSLRDASFTLELESKEYLRISWHLMTMYQQKGEVALDVSPEVLTHICTYLTDHRGVDPIPLSKPLKGSLADCVAPKDLQFIETVAESRQALYDLIEGARVAGLRELMNLGCAKIASLIRGHGADTLRNALSANGDT